MKLDSDGFVRPAHSDGASPERGTTEWRAFHRACPGLNVARPSEHHIERDSIFGPYVSVWRGWATDPALRSRGSSGGTISAISEWLLVNGRVSKVASVAPAPRRPGTTVPLTLTTRADIDRAAGSRYAPVAALGNDDVTDAGAIIGKPCEIAAYRAAHPILHPLDEAPVLFSFFCAGVPSQFATDHLVRKLGLDPDHLVSLRYRGNGWPGSFEAVDRSGRRVEMDYNESWGHELGPTMQWRCKICPDGVGESADIVAGDFWKADDRGYPVFASAEGDSVLIARTRRGHELLMEAVDAGAIAVEPVVLTMLHSVQPLQVERRQQLAGRLLGVRFAGRTIPSYRGFGLVSIAARRPYRRLIRPMLGSFIRMTRARRRSRAGAGRGQL